VSGFDPLASRLRRAVLDYYEERGEALDGEAGRNTLETNSGLVPRRAEPLVEMLSRRGAMASPAGMRILDLGCGFGGLSVYFASLGAEVTGIDANGSRLVVPRAVAESAGLTATFGEAQMENLPLADGCFDLALMNNSLCYVVDRAERHRALSEALRVLRPQGTLLIRNPNRWALTDPFTGVPLLGALPGGLPQRVAETLGRPRSRVLLLSLRAARCELREAGFGDVVDLPVPGRLRPYPLRMIARYQHLFARRAA
jgi:SAM-dependent methyltransferase